MISHPVAGAVIALQEQALASRGTYELDRLERALDELLRNPSDAVTPTRFRVRSAMGHAYEALERRRAIASPVPLDIDRAYCGHVDGRYLVVELMAWLSNEPGLAKNERSLLVALARGGDAASLAARHGLPLPRMRERISRARRNARALWQNAEATA